MSAKKNPEEKYRHLHVVVPPYLEQIVRARAARDKRSIGQVVADALLLTYGEDNGSEVHRKD